MRDRTDCARLLRAFVRAWPLDIGGFKDGRRYGFKFHTGSQRGGELARLHGFDITPMHQCADGVWRNQLADRATFERARLQVKAWETGIDVATLEIQESLRPVRQEALALAGGGA